MRLFLTLVFFASGLSGLVYQVLWMRKFATILGTSYLAVSVVVAAFMLGLFLGAHWIGKRIDKINNELRWYAILEAIIGIYALLLIPLLPIMEGVYASLYQITPERSIVGITLTSVLTILILLIPTSAMGATLPLIVRYFTRQFSEFKNQISHFYGINTLGGALGALIAGFILIEKIGTNGSIIITAILNLLIAIIVWIKLKESKSRQKDTAQILPPIQEDSSSKTNSRWIQALLITAFLSGFCALAYEILWTRSLKIIIQSTTYGFSIMLFIFLTGIGLGSFWAKQKFKENRAYSYGIMQLALAIYAVFTIVFLYKWIYTDFFQTKLWK